MMSRITSFGLPAALLSVSLFAACQNTARGVEQDTDRNTAAARDHARDAGAEARQESREAGQSMERAADHAAQETRDAARSVGDTVDAAQQTMQIKTALTGSDKVDASHIDVDTDAATKTVTLKGYVPTAAQKTEAARIAKEKAPEYTVHNRLEVKR